MKTAAVVDRDFILSRIKVNDRGCWIWQGTTGQRGTRAMHNGEYVYRISYRLFVGPIPDGLWINHHCDDGTCVNPEHIYAGTPADNSRDMVERGRLRLPDNRGERNGNAYPDALIDALRGRYAAGETQTGLAAEYGVSLSAVRKWVTGHNRGRTPISRTPQREQAAS